MLQQLRSHVGPEGLALLNNLEQQVVGNSGAAVQQQQQSVFQAAAALQQPALQLSGNPFGFLEPTIGRLPATAAALGYKTDMGRAAQTMVALGDYIVDKLSSQPLWQGGPGLGPAPLATGMQQVPAATAAAAAAAEDTDGDDSSMAGPGPVPGMSTFNSFSHYTSWYTAEQPAGYSHTRMELEKASEYSWRKGCDKRRWSDHRKLWRVVKGKAKLLTAADSADDIASYTEAATALDIEFRMKPSAYFNKYLKPKGNKVAAQSDSSSGQAAAGAARRVRPKRRRQQAQEKGEGEAAAGEEEQQPPQAKNGGRAGRAGRRSRGRAPATH